MDARPAFESQTAYGTHGLRGAPDIGGYQVAAFVIENICANSGHSVFVALRLCEVLYIYSACSSRRAFVTCLRRLYSVAVTMAASCCDSAPVSDDARGRRGNGIVLSLAWNSKY